GLGAKLVQNEVAGLNVLVVATEAVGLNGGPLRCGMLRDLVRGLGEDLGVGRNDTDGTRNADKPASEFHISPFQAVHTEWWSKAGSTTPAWFESLSFAGAAMLCAKKAAAHIVQAAAPRRVTDRSRSNSPSHVYVLISRTYSLLSLKRYSDPRLVATRVVNFFGAGRSRKIRYRPIAAPRHSIACQRVALGRRRL